MSQALCHFDLWLKVPRTVLSAHGPGSCQASTGLRSPGSNVTIPCARWGYLPFPMRHLIHPSQSPPVTPSCLPRQPSVQGLSALVLGSQVAGKQAQVYRWVFAQNQVDSDHLGRTWIPIPQPSGDMLRPRTQQCSSGGKSKPDQDQIKIPGQEGDCPRPPFKDPPNPRGSSSFPSAHQPLLLCPGCCLWGWEKRDAPAQAHTAFQRWHSWPLKHSHQDRPPWNPKGCHRTHRGQEPSARAWLCGVGMCPGVPLTFLLFVGQM